MVRPIMNKKKLIFIIILVVSIIILCLFLLLNNQKRLNNSEYIDPGFGDINNYLYNSAVVNFNYANMASKNVQTALDEIYTSIIGGCGTGYSKTSENAGTYSCSKNTVGANQSLVISSSNIKYNRNRSNSLGTNVNDALVELAVMRSDCKDGYTKENILENSYDCKKSLTLTANGQAIAYGEDIDTDLDEVMVNGLREGDTLHSITLTPSTTEITNNGTITISNAVIYDANNVDITSSYSITYVNGSLVISAHVCKPPTAVNIANNGVVSWTASNNADSYEISIDGTNYTEFTSGSSYNSAITLATGTRTVYVRSFCDGVEFDNNYSSAAVKNTNVYSVALTNSAGISATTGSGNYITGSTITLGATVKSGYTWSKWVQTTGGADVSTTQTYSITLSSNIAYTATATGNSYTVNYYKGNGTSTAGSTKIGSSSCTFGTACTLKTWATLGAVFPYSSSASTDRGWSFYGWSNATNSTSLLYSNGASINPSSYSSTINLYAIGRKTYRFNSGIAPKSYTTVYQYWNPHSTNASYRTSINVPSATSLSASSNGKWTFLGYIGGSNSASNGDVHFASSVAGTSYNPVIDIGATGYMRAKYSRTLTIKYNANGGSGSMSNTTLTQYYNSGIGNAAGDSNSGATLGGHSITLASNGFTRSTSRYKFDKWAEGSSSGTKYAAKASYTALGSTVKSTSLTVTMYAVWKDCCSGYTNISAYSGTYCYRTPVLETSTQCNYTFNGQCYYDRLNAKC